MMHSLIAVIGLLSVMATSAMAVPMYDYYGPIYGTKAKSARIDPGTFAGYFTPEQIRSIWSKFEKQREQLVRANVSSRTDLP